MSFKNQLAIEDTEKSEFAKKELSEALRAVNSLLHKCRKSLEKIDKNTSQQTLLINRINALNIALLLIDKELQKTESKKN